MGARPGAPIDPRAAPDPVREEAFEARFEAAPAVVVVMALQFAIGLTIRAGHWTLWPVPWWASLIGIVPETVLLLILILDRSHSLERLGHRTTVSFALFAVVSLANALLLVALLASLIGGHEHDGGQLLFKALIVWTTNTITFEIGRASCRERV